MPIGDKARNPNTPFFLYEFVFNGKVFYVGHTYHKIRAHGRWSYVKNLVRLEQQGKLPPAKRSDLYTPSNQVIAALIRAGQPEHQVTIPWQGMGKQQAEIEEKRQIQRRCAEGCVLTNVAHNPKQTSVDEVLRYLGVPPKAAAATSILD